MWLRSNNFAFIRNAFLGPTNDMGVHRRDHPLCVDERDVAVYQWSLSRAGGTTAGALACSASQICLLGVVAPFASRKLLIAVLAVSWQARGLLTHSPCC